MAAVSDSIAATVTLKADGAIKDLNTLSRQAKQTGASFNEAGRTTTAATSKMTTGVNRATVSAGKATTGFGNLRGSISSTSQAMGVFGTAVGVVAGASAGILSAANAASRLNEQAAATKVTFGSASGQVRDFSKTTATGLGVAAAEALKAANQFGAFFKQAGFADKASAKMSTTLVQLAGDLASFRNVGVDQSLAAISSGLAGESEPLRRLGVDLRILKVDAEALASGFASTKDEITETDRVAARYVSLLRQTGDAQTDAARTANEYANTQRRLAATTEDLKANLGQPILPSLTDLAQGLSLLAASATRGTAPLKEAGISLADFGKAAGKAALNPVTAPVVFLKELGAAGKDTGDKMAAAAKVYNDAVGKFGDKSPEATAAIVKLRAEVDAAEKEAIRTGQAFESTARGAARIREEASAAAGSLRSFVDAQRAGEDATFKVADSRRTLDDAERSLAEIRARGPVDAEKVVEAERAVADAARTTIDARERQSDAERKLSDLRAAGPVDAEKVADAERSVAEATRGVTSARRSLAEAEKELARLRAGPTADEAGDAGRAVSRAQLDLERARRRVTEAEQAARVAGRQGPAAAAEAALDLRDAQLSLADAIDALQGAQRDQNELNARGQAGSEALTDAVAAVADAQARLENATRTKAEAERDERAARAGDPDYQRKMAGLIRDVEGAKRGVEAATRGEKEAGDALRTARAGDPDFERNLAEATRAVEAAVRGVQRAAEDLPFATDIAARAEAELAAKMRDGSEAADTLRDSLRLLDEQRLRSLGMVPLAEGIRGDFGSLASISPGGRGPLMQRAAGGPVSAGTPYIVGERRPELFVPNQSGYIVPSVPSSAGDSSTHYHFDAPLPAGLVQQIEYAGRLNDWRTAASGRR